MLKYITTNTINYIRSCPISRTLPFKLIKLVLQEFHINEATSSFFNNLLFVLFKCLAIFFDDISLNIFESNIKDGDTQKIVLFFVNFDNDFTAD